MFKIIAVTNRSLCIGDFDKRLSELVRAGIDSIILREKDLTALQYEELAKRAMRITKGTSTTLAAHSFIDVAKNLCIKNIHLPLAMLEQNQNAVKDFDVIGISVHSLEEANKAVLLGASYLTAGHIFETACKSNLPPKGLDFLKNLCKQIPLPIYAIGGITEKTIAKAKSSGADGVCLMSSIMEAPDISGYLKKLEQTYKKDCNGKAGF